MRNKGKVTVIIPSYNAEKYIRESIDSVLSQTYKNIEILIQDNQSTDRTYEIECEYAVKYPDTIRIFKNPVNLGGGTQNIINVIPNVTGEFCYLFSADDVMLPDCISRCVAAAEKYPSVGLVLIERDEITEDGSPIDYLPFFDRSFFCEGEKLLPVLMMSGLTTLSQIMVRMSHYRNSDGLSNIYLVPTDWNLNFRMAMVSDVVYLREAGIKYRIYVQNETSMATVAMLQIVEHYQMLIDFVRHAKNEDLPHVYNREGEAVKKLGSMSLRYAMEMIKNNYYDTARDYLDFAQIFDPEIINDNLYIMLSKYLSGDVEKEKPRLLKSIAQMSAKRALSYHPPEEHVELKEHAE